MWQVGRVSHRGSGAMLVVGPLGVALVTEGRVSAARDVVEGRAGAATLTAPATAAGEALLLLDLSGPAPQVTLSGEVAAQAWRYGEDSPRIWEAPLEAETVDPLQWVALDVEATGQVRDQTSDQSSGMWLPLSEGVCRAGVVRIGIPGASRAVSPIPAAPMTTVPGDLPPAPSTPITPITPPTPSGTEGEQTPLVPPPPPETPDEPETPAPGVPSDTSDTPDYSDTPVAPDYPDAPHTPDHPVAPDTPDTPDSCEPPVTAHTADFEETPDASEIPTPTGTGIPSTWAAVLDARTAPPSSLGALEDTLTTWDTTRLGASPSRVLPSQEASPHASETGEPDPPAFNPEAFERTMTPALLEELRRQAARAQGSTLPPTSGTEHPAPSALQSGRGTVEAEQATPDPPPTAFLVYAGAAPVELTRDVVIGRDPDTRALTGRPPAATLRVPSPAGEISRSHCVVLSTTPTSWSVMDLGSANGTVLRTPHTDPRPLPAQVATTLGDGDLVDLGEGIVVEFRVRPQR